jgi:hypothetical protein
MTDIERNWPSEMLAEVVPEHYAHLVFDWTEGAPAPAPLYTVDYLPGGCTILSLVGGQEAWRAAHQPVTSPNK